MTETAETLRKRMVIPRKYLKPGKIDSIFGSQSQMTTRVKIDAKGRFHLADEESKSRVAYLLEKGLTKIPIKVVERDPEWTAFVKSLTNSKRTIYQPITHPDFQDFRVARGSERLEMIAEDLQGQDLKGKKVLDVGSCLGYFARWFNKQGAHVEGVEEYRSFFNACQKLNDVKGTGVEYHQKDIRKWLQSTGKDKLFDIILCLSVIHNIAQSGDPEGAVRALQTLSEKAPTMYFDIGQEEEGISIKRAGLPEDLVSGDPEKAARFIKQNTAYTTANVIGQQKEYCKRNLYKLTRQTK